MCVFQTSPDNFYWIKEGTVECFGVHCVRCWGLDLGPHTWEVCTLSLSYPCPEFTLLNRDSKQQENGLNNRCLRQYLGGKKTFL